MTGDFVIFALVDEAHNPEAPRRIPLGAQLQTDITSLLEEQAVPFYSPTLNPIDFDGGYSVDGADIFQVKDFVLPHHFSELLDNPHAAPPLTSTEIEGFRVKAVVATRQSGSTREMLFQALDRSSVITKRRSLLVSRNAFTQLKETGIVLGAKLCAVWKNGTLRFFSYNVARKLLDLADLFEEATNDDIVAVLKTPVFAKANHNAVIGGANQWMRRRFALVLGSGILKAGDPKKIQKMAKRYGVKITLANDRLIFPEDDHAEARELLRFLSEEYYEGVISGKPFMTNSKIAVKAAALP